MTYLKALRSYKRPSKSLSEMPWTLDDPCPCGSGRPFDLCCKLGRDFPEFSLPRLAPPGPKTGFSHDKCYLAFTQDCSADISREHYISENVLALIPDLHVSGKPWTEPGVRKRIGIKSLTAKILCERHNHSLAPIDEHGGRAIRIILEATEYVTSKSLSRRSAYTFLSGHMLELWALKVLLGMLHASLARDNDAALLDSVKVPKDFVVAAFYGHNMPSPVGLYARPVIGEPPENYFAFAPITSESNGELVGLIFRVQHLEFWFAFFLDPEMKVRFKQNERWHRPLSVDLNGPRRSVRALLAWPPGLGTFKHLEFNFGR